MKKKFLSNLALLLFLNLLIKPFWFFGIEVAVQNRVGEEMYGFYFSLFNFAFILNILLDSGITNFNNRNIARHPDRLRESLAQIVPLKFILAIVYAGIVFITGWIIGYNQVQFKMLVILALNQFLASMILYMRSNISGLQLFRTDSLLSVLDRTLMILITGVLLWSNLFQEPFRIEWFVYAQSASYILTLGVVTLLVLKRSGTLTLSWKRAHLKNILRQSYPFAILILLMAFFNRADSVMIERLLPDGKAEAGIYAQSFRVLDAVSQFSLLFAGLLLPMFSRMLKTGEHTRDLVRMAAGILLSVSIGVAIAGHFYKTDIITLLYHRVERHSDRIFGYLMISYVFIATSYIYGTLLTANRNLKQLNILALITVILNISLNLVLIPEFKALGAAWASMISQGFYAVSQVVTAHRTLRLPLPKSFILQLLFFTMSSFAAGYAIRGFLDNRWLGFLLLCFILAALALLLRLINLREIRDTLLYEES